MKIIALLIGSLSIFAVHGSLAEAADPASSTHESCDPLLKFDFRDELKVATQDRDWGRLREKFGQNFERLLGLSCTEDELKDILDAAGWSLIQSYHPKEGEVWVGARLYRQWFFGLFHRDSTDTGVKIRLVNQQTTLLQISISL